MSEDYSGLRYVNNLSLRSRCLRMIWGLVWMFCFRMSPGFGFDAWRRMLLRCFGAKIGAGCRIDPSCRIWAPWNLEMGGYSALGAGVDCYSVAKITIGSKVAVSQRSFLCTASHDITSLLRPLTSRPITIHDHAWICAEAFIGPGVTVGEKAVAAARAVVVRNVAQSVIVGGNPARPIGNRKLNS